MKKILLGLGTIAALSAPVATVVACGSSESVPPSYVKARTLTVEEGEKFNTLISTPDADGYVFDETSFDTSKITVTKIQNGNDVTWEFEGHVKDDLGQGVLGGTLKAGDKVAIQHILIGTGTYAVKLRDRSDTVPNEDITRDVQINLSLIMAATINMFLETEDK